MSLSSSTSLRGQGVLVLGLGASGLAMARWCARQGAAFVRVADSRAEPPQAGALAAALPGAQLRHGFDPALLDGVQRVFKSPGLSPRDPALAPLLAQAAASGIAVDGELKLFIDALAALKAERGYAPKVIAVTGTNGKTTVTKLAGLLVERSGLVVAVAGNVGPSLLATLMEALDREPLPSPRPSPTDVGEGAGPTPSPATAGEGWGEGPECWVLELSSFQLEGIEGFEPDAAVVLNVSEDHLDWHGSMADYSAAKARIYGRAGVMVVNRDDAAVEAMAQAAQAPAFKSGRKLERSRSASAASAAREHRIVRFGLDAPRAPGDYGLVTEGGMAWLVRALESDVALPRRRKPDAQDTEIVLQRLMPADALRIRGRHNAANALAALALATAIGRPLAPMLHGLRDYRGEPHRVEPIGMVRGIEAFDDSKGTNVGATVAALRGLGDDKAPGRLAVVLGGDGKGQDFAPLAAPIARHARAVALIGRDASALDAALAATGVPRARHASLQDATRWCFEQAQAGDAVLLSPACASLDMFRDYQHRAEVFVNTVHALAVEQGEVA